MGASQVGSKVSEKESLGSNLSQSALGSQLGGSQITGATGGDRKGAVSEDERNDVRKMDHRVNKMEVRCGQEKRKLERQAYLIHQVGTGINHLKRMLDTMDAQCPLPILKRQSVAFDELDESAKLLMTIEEKVVSVIEKVTLGTNKQIGDDRKLSIAQRQSQIAEVIMSEKMSRGAVRRPKERGELEERVAPDPGKESAVLNSPPGIRIKTAVMMDDDFDGDMKMLLVKNDMNADLEEAEILGADVDTGTEEINKFIMEACSTEQSVSQQRKANLLSSGSEVNHKDMGLTMGIVMAETEARLAKENSGGKMIKGSAKKSPRSMISVNDRQKIKKMSGKLVKKKLREAEKFMLEKIAEEKAAML